MGNRQCKGPEVTQVRACLVKSRKGREVSVSEPRRGGERRAEWWGHEEGFGQTPGTLGTREQRDAVSKNCSGC